MNKLIIATNNSGKLAEIQALLHPIECIAQQSIGISEVEETGLSFVENALLKARHASQTSQLAALADDSGLVVPALQGRPGIFSARFAGPNASDQDNIIELLQSMREIPATERQAFFYCAIVLVTHANDPTPLIATGSLNGVITTAPSGKNGFGYDPVFYLPEHQCTLAELPFTVKNQISHRVNALSHLIRHLRMMP